MDTVNTSDKKTLLAIQLLKTGLAGVFLYAAIASLISPANWIGYFPSFLRHLIAPHILMVFFSFYQILLSIWLLSSKKSFYAALISSLTLGGILISNLGILDIVFRDFAILFSALSLAVLTKES